MKAKLVITRGLPASGKTTWAKRWVAEDPEHRIRVNRDDLRQMAAVPYSHENEQRIIKQRDMLIDEFLCKGYEVINDDTNLPNRAVRDLRKIAKRTGAEFEVRDFTDIDIDECHARNGMRSLKGERSVPTSVIEDMHKRYIKGKPWPLPVPEEEDIHDREQYVKYVPDQSKPTAFIFDIDGTVATMNGRSPYDYTRVSEDLPVELVLGMAELVHYAGHHVIFLSGRKYDCYEDTFDWLAKHTQISSFELRMRNADDNRRDSIVKYEIFDRHVRNNYNVLGVFDDRDQVVEMWRKVGLQCYQVNYGNF
jgi:predicted kinase